MSAWWLLLAWVLGAAMTLAFIAGAGRLSRTAEKDEHESLYR